MLTRRNLLALSATAAAIGAFQPTFAFARAQRGVSPALMSRAMAALEKHSAVISNRDVIAITDFAQASHTPRFHIVDLESGEISSHLVAHGYGSDPGHTGWLQRFSNDPGSHASSSGAYRTEALYDGKHGRSIRLSGLEATNSNAMDRAIVVHPAWYVCEDMVRQHGVLGRSDGCFTLSETSIQVALARLGPGRLIYADKLA